MSCAKTLIVVVSLCITSTALGQFQLDGAVELQPYYGLQNHLISGVSPLPALEQPLVRHVCLVAPDVMAITVDARAIKHAGPRPYQKEPEDRVELTGPLTIAPGALAEAAGIGPWLTDEHRRQESAGLWRFIYRGETKLGWLIGRHGESYWPVQPMLGDRLDTAWADDVRHYLIESPDDASYEEPVHPGSVQRKSRPMSRSSEGPEWHSFHGERHEIYLQLPEPLTVGKNYRITFAGTAPFAQPLTFRFDDTRLRSEAIHVNLAGYHPDQSPKTAFLSTWMGSSGGIAYPEGLIFHVISNSTNQKVYSGNVTLVHPWDKPEISTDRFGPENFYHADVYACDFSNFNRPGCYRVTLPGIGCSFPFQVSEKLWEDAVRLQMLGFLHQRSGIALGPPLTEFRRPRNYHPEDGVDVHYCDPEKFFDPSIERYAHDTFERIQRSILLETSHRGAYGGWADAADYDRRLIHLRAVQRMLDLHEYDPQYFQQLQLRVPETVNEIPDVIDEALWCLELFRRTQRTDGAVINGVESIRHPSKGETSYRDSQPIAMLPPTTQSTTYYAGTAAQMAWALRQYDPELTAVYSQSAVAAATWLDVHQETDTSDGRSKSVAQQNYMAACLYRLTGEQRWHDLFHKSLQELFPDGMSQPFNRSRLDGIRVYVMLAATLVDAELQRQCHEAVIRSANDLVTGGQQLASGMLRHTADSFSGPIIEQQGSEILALAHSLTGDDKYIQALVRCSQYGMGANPLNLAFTCGLGDRHIHPWHHDSDYANVPAPVGIPAYGPIPIRRSDKLPPNAWGWDERKPDRYGEYLCPQSVYDWPLMEQYFRYVGFAGMNEFTVHQGMAEQLFRWGYLAQHCADQPFQ